MLEHRQACLDRFTRHAALVSLLLLAALPATMGVACCTDISKAYPRTRPSTQPASSPATVPSVSLHPIDKSPAGAAG
jgi:hypothetical protein